MPVTAERVVKVIRHNEQDVWFTRRRFRLRLRIMRLAGVISGHQQRENSGDSEIVFHLTLLASGLTRRKPTLVTGNAMIEINPADRAAR